MSPAEPARPVSAAESIRIFLASASPRRRSILRSLGVPHETLSPNVDEAANHPESPRALVLHNAALKAQAGAELAPDPTRPAAVIGADTIVVIDGEVLGKPASRAEARAMLARLSGRTHEVFTGVAIKLIPNQGLWLDARRAEVVFNALSAEQIETYTASGESDDKAGAYGIQGGGGAFIADVRGDLSAVIGFPLDCVVEGIEAITGLKTHPRAGHARIIADAFPDMNPRLLQFVL